MKIFDTQYWRIELAAAICFALLCTGCVSTQSLPSSVKLPDKDHGYFVIGVKPANASILVFKGAVVDGRFKQEKFVTASFNGAPTDGFVVNDTHAGNTLAITFVALDSSERWLYSPCGNAKTIVFTVPAGKVVYVRSVTYSRTATGVSAHFSSDFETARAFMQKHYPQLANALEQGTSREMPAGYPQCPY